MLLVPAAGRQAHQVIRGVRNKEHHEASSLHYHPMTHSAPPNALTLTVRPKCVCMYCHVHLVASSTVQLVYSVCQALQPTVPGTSLPSPQPPTHFACLLRCIKAGCSLIQQHGVTGRQRDRGLRGASRPGLVQFVHPVLTP